MDTIKFTTVPKKTLYQSILSTDTSFKLADITGFDGVNLTSASFGTIGYGVMLNPGRTVMELFSWDPTTIANASIDFIDRGLPFDGGDTPVVANKLEWPGGQTTVLLGSDTPQFIQWLKDYIDSVAIAGAPNASTTVKGIVEVATQAEYDAGTDTGGTGAKLISTPATTRGKKYNDYAVDAAGSDAYAITITPAITAYVAGQVFTFKAGTANTGAATLNVSGLGAKTIKKDASTDLATGDILSGQIVVVVYDSVTDTMKVVSSLAGAHDATLLTGLVPLASLQAVNTTAGVGNAPATSSTQTITHNLGRTPKIIRIYGHGGSVGSTIGQPALVSYGIFNSSGNFSIYDISVDGGPSGTNPVKSSTVCINLMEKNQNTGSAIINNVGATTFDLVWTVSATMVNAVYMWEAE